MSIPDQFDHDFTFPEGSMLILTTIYFTELKDLGSEGTKENSFSLEPSAAKSRELFRELLSLYEGRNRVLPIDRNS
ncbi:MAG TPA: hypothetical protein VGI45_07775 [Terracidiphilus sp.]